jgi:hypothetical protein
MLVLMCSFPLYMFSRCVALSGDVFCPIVSRVTARDNQLRGIERLRSSRSLALGSCRIRHKLLSSLFSVDYFLKIFIYVVF